ncbi:MAG: hypothetical protein ACE5JJ_00540 [Nitrospinota bacterium]
MGAYQIFFNGLAVGFLLGFLCFYAVYHVRTRRLQKSKDEIDRLIEDFHAYYRKVSEGENSDPHE